MLTVSSDAELLYVVGITAENNMHFNSEAGSILMMVQDDLTLIVPPSSHHLVQYIDVPLECIQGMQARQSEIRGR